ncbi:MAG: hydrolase 1, exosortase A system-associated [Pseudomonadota bacterium]
MNYQERALSFTCHGEDLVGIVGVPEQANKRGVLIVVGGPQYRAGSHRQFILLARGLAEQGIAVMRFDYRGMGDSGGAARDFEAVDDDLRAAVDQFIAAVPGLEEVVIWGLCDGASAALFYAYQDARVTGLVLINPWVRTSASIAKTTLKHYYRARLLDPALWKKIARGQFNFAAAGGALLRLVGSVLSSKTAAGAPNTAASPGAAPVKTAAVAPLPQRMQAGLDRFGGKVLLIISGADLTAKEFLDLTSASRQWRALLAAPRVTRQDLAGADHTFSRRVWRDQVIDWTGAWMRSW